MQQEIKHFPFDGECDDDWMEFDCLTDDPRDSLMLNKQLEEEIKSSEQYQKQSFDQRIEFLQKEKERLFQEIDDEIVVCDVDGEVVDRKCREPQCNYESVDETHMESECCFKTNSANFNPRRVSAETFLKSKHAQHLLDEFFGTSLQKAIIFSYEYYIEDTESPSSFIKMIKDWEAMNRNPPTENEFYADKTPIMRLMMMMDIYGPGLTVESFLRCCVRLHKRRRYMENMFGFGNSQNDMYELMRKLKLVKIFSDMDTMVNALLHPSTFSALG